MTFEENSDQGYRKYVIALWTLAVLGVLGVFVLFLFISVSKLPDTAELENPKFKESTLVLSSDGEELGRYFTENRQWVTYEDLSTHLVNALISTEDVRFHNHSGIDFKGTVRAFVFLGQRGGASTISQQLAHLFFTQRSRNIARRVWQKLQEWVIAIEFEKRYTKEEIIAMYLNKYDFLNDAIGVGSAANVYFGKDQKNLTVDEAAILIGMLQNPSLFNPIRNEENTIHKRMLVLKKMEEHRHISTQEYNELRVLPIDKSNFKRPINYDGLAPYFRNELTKKLRSLIRDGSIALKPDGTSYNIYRDGLKIHTTLDSRYQRHAEDAMRRHMRSLQALYFKKWEGLDPWKYEANDYQLRLRQNALNFQVESSERFKSLRNKHLKEITKEISGKIEGVRLWNTDIKRMLKAESDEYALEMMNNEGIISKSQMKTYKELMASEYWRPLKRKWAELRREAKKEFSIKRKMTVFSYENGGEKEVYMTPLDSIKYHRMHLQLGSVAIEPQTGYVKSWVGGIDYKYFKFDHVTSNRQVGSTFKPFLYTTALMNGFSPCYKVDDIQYTIAAGDENFKIQDSWSPANADDEFSEERYTLKEALKKSLNSVSVWLIKELGSVAGVVQLAANMGIDARKIPKVPSIALGVPALSVLEMTSAYTTFSNDGIHTKPLFIERIEDKNGAIIYEGKIEQNRALGKNYNHAMVEMLKYASSFIDPLILTDLGGKTGTTDDYVDGWFIGITPNLTIGTWVGGEDSWIRFLTLNEGQGGVMARPNFINYMQALENDPEIKFNTNAKFLYPGDIGIELDCDTYIYPVSADSLEQDSLLLDDDLPDEFDDHSEEELNE